MSRLTKPSPGSRAQACCSTVRRCAPASSSAYKLCTKSAQAGACRMIWPTTRLAGLGGWSSNNIAGNSARWQTCWHCCAVWAAKMAAAGVLALKPLEISSWIICQAWRRPI